MRYQQSKKIFVELRYGLFCMSTSCVNESIQYMQLVFLCNTVLSFTQFIWSSCRTLQVSKPTYHIIAVVTCSILPSQNASLTPASESGIYNYNTIVTHSCNKGFAMTIGTPKQSCTEEGTWTGTTPTCSLHSMLQ